MVIPENILITLEYHIAVDIKMIFPVLGLNVRKNIYITLISEVSTFIAETLPVEIIVC
jgi:hypothetical protein